MKCLKSKLLSSILALSLLALPSGKASLVANRVRLEPKVGVAGLRTEYNEDPLGIDVTRPRLSWQLQSLGANQRGVKQSAYQVRVAPSLGKLQLGTNLVWDSGEVHSDDSIQQPYGGSPLRSGQRYYWQV